MSRFNQHCQSSYFLLLKFYNLLLYLIICDLCKNNFMLHGFSYLRTGFYCTSNKIIRSVSQSSTGWTIRSGEMLQCVRILRDHMGYPHNKQSRKRTYINNFKQSDFTHINRSVFPDFLELSKDISFFFFFLWIKHKLIIFKSKIETVHSSLCVTTQRQQPENTRQTKNTSKPKQEQRPNITKQTCKIST